MAVRLMKYSNYTTEYKKQIVGGTGRGKLQIQSDNYWKCWRIPDKENLENLRGTLFEFLMHSVLYKWLRGQLTGNLITNYKINYDDNKKLVYEYDIIAPLYDEYLVIELKGYANSHFFDGGNKEESGKYEKETLGWFFRNTFPVAQKYYAHNPDNKKVKACFITTAHFDKEAKEQLGQIGKGKLKSAYMEVAYDGKRVVSQVENIENVV